jgi:two-component system phosphate regulon sensor histidine kinase PhoR
MRFPKALRRLLLGYVVLHLLAAGLFVFGLATLVRSQMVQGAREEMEAVASLLIEHVNELDLKLKDPSLPSHLKRIGDETQMRFTLILEDGAVVADSDTGVRDIGSHQTREEVLDAAKLGVGFSQRRSDTLDKQMMYFARRFKAESAADSASSDQAANDIMTENEGYVRVALPMASISAAVGKVQAYVIYFAMGLMALTGFLMAIYSSRHLRPLSQFAEAAKQIGTGVYDSPTEIPSSYDEWKVLGDAFEEMQRELKLRENRLLEGGQRLEAVLSSMIEGVIAIEQGGEVMLANRAACRMLSISKEKLVGRKMEEVRIAELTAAIDVALLERSFSKTEFTTTTDPRRTIKARVSLLANNENPGVAVVLHDVTELRQLETMRQDFVANVSHELKTPLASIKAYAETLKMGALHDPDKNLQFVQQIEFQADVLNQQIQDLLQLARVESGRKTFSVADVKVNSICELLHEQFQQKAEARDLRLEMDFEEPSPVARCDAEGLETVVRNLIVNATHYTPGGGLVSIRTRTDGDRVIVSVSDTGIGIATEQQARVFERFYRVDKARSRDMGGTGLGLAIVKHLTQAFGGTVDLESKLGKGSTFRVSLPAGRSEVS